VARPSDYNPEFCEQVIELGKQGMSKAEIASELGVAKQTLYNWMDAHPEFMDAVKEATAFAQAWWEKAGRTAVFGGSPGFNSTAYIFTMKNMFGDDWRDKVTQEHTGPDGSPIQFNTVYELPK
jgi:hypothetical protein